MLGILIFHHNQIECERIRKVLEQYAKKQNRLFEVEVIYEQEKLFGYIALQQDLDVIFLDIQAGENIDGISLANKIKLIRPKAAVVFVTEYIDYTSDSYDAKNMHFVMRKNLEQQLNRIFMKLDFLSMERNRGYMHIHTKGKELVIREENIVYLERKGRSTFVKCKSELIEITEKLSELEERLNPVLFVRCHNSFMVNFMAVREFTRTEFLLRDNSIIPISRYKLDETREKFLVWSKQYV